jgi:hypothetical protein
MRRCGMRIENVSSVIRTSGSDYDVVVWLSDAEWALASRFAEPVANQIPVSIERFGIQVDAYLVPESNPGVYTVAAVESARIQREWDAETVVRYATEKETLSHLRGRERKQAKAELARRFGLPSVQYTA